jgi:hypothetical protein
MASLPEQCCTLPPFKSDYQPVGERTKIKVGEKDVDIYITGPNDSKNALIGLHGKSFLQVRVVVA